jgi:molybdopterin/thiamine biosynthesis adenylyltransferase
MKNRLSIQERHFHQVKEFILPESGHERSAYILCSLVKIEADPWTGEPSQRFISYEVIPVEESEVVSSSAQHITWSTQSVANVLRRAQAKNLTVALVHSHPGGLLEFSEQDDRNESDLIQLAQNRNGSITSMLSLVVTPDWQLIGRLWVSPRESHPINLIQVIGERIKLYYPERGLGQSSDVLNRQALAFGSTFNQDLAQLRVGIVGLGGTGSASCALTARLGIRKFALFDKDIVEKSNLNRLHNATMADAQSKRPKVEVAARFLNELDFGIEVQTYQQWINDPKCRDALRSCDIIFACTDDHAGRLILNRFAYYYATPVIDLGLAIEVSKGESPEIQALDGRVTVLQPGYPCLLCREIINPKIAGDQILKYQNPEEYERRKEEAYVLGEGNPSPSVVLFTTDVASMALQEFVHRLQGFRGNDGAVQQQVRKFKLRQDRCQGTSPKPHCPVCGSTELWGIGDTGAFLGLTGLG